MDNLDKRIIDLVININVTLTSDDMLASCSPKDRMLALLEFLLFPLEMSLLLRAVVLELLKLGDEIGVTLTRMFL